MYSDFIKAVNIFFRFNFFTIYYFDSLMRFRRFSEAEKLCGNNYFSKTLCLFHCAKYQHLCYTKIVFVSKISWLLINNMLTKNNDVEITESGNWILNTKFSFSIQIYLSPFRLQLIRQVISIISLWNLSFFFCIICNAYILVDSLYKTNDCVPLFIIEIILSKWIFFSLNENSFIFKIDVKMIFLWKDNEY